MMSKEYGGYLPFEFGKKTGEFFGNILEDDIVRLNCGRCAFWYSLKEIMPSKVYVPYLNCAYSTDPIEDLGIDYEYYYLNNDLLPSGVEPGKGDAIVWINYYGNATEEQLNAIKALAEETNVIIDNCHAFFTPPIKNAYNCYSARKFFGVCDGAYLIKHSIRKMELEEGNSSDYIGFILNCIEKGTNACYQQNLENEKRLENSYTRMSKITRNMLERIDYSKIQTKRNDNIKVLDDALDGFNQFRVNMDSKTHMYYPFLYFSDSLRQSLVNRKIYTPTWWRHVPDYFDTDQNNIEIELSRYMIMLPIDQRYDAQDMKDIARIVIEEINNANRY